MAVARYASVGPVAAQRRGQVGVVRAVWIVVAVVTSALLGVAGWLLFKMQLFTPIGTLTDSQLASLWAFLGVSLGVVATLIGSLFAEQANRRSDERAAQAERRMTLDTRAKVLELMTDSGNYAQKARVGGAIATMMELDAGPLAFRILSDVWSSGNIGTSTAVWLLDGVLSDHSAPAEEKEEAAFLLITHLDQLILDAADETSIGMFYWPEVLDMRRDDDGNAQFNWPILLPLRARSTLLEASLKVLMTRPLDYWLETNAPFPLYSIVAATRDPSWDLSSSAAVIVRALVAAGLFDTLIRPYGELVPELCAEDHPIDIYLADLTPIALRRWIEKQREVHAAS